jgi:hypothetical protein
MTEYAKPLDVTTSPVLERLVEQVQRTRQPVPLTRDDQVVAIVQPPPAQTGDRAEKSQTTSGWIYPTLESLAGAAGSLPEPRPWKEVLEEARQDGLARKLPPRDVMKHSSTRTSSFAC